MRRATVMRKALSRSADDIGQPPFDTDEQPGVRGRDTERARFPPPCIVRQPPFDVAIHLDLMSDADRTAAGIRKHAVYERSTFPSTSPACSRRKMFPDHASRLWARYEMAIALRCLRRKGEWRERRSQRPAAPSYSRNWWPQFGQNFGGPPSGIAVSV